MQRLEAGGRRHEALVELQQMQAACARFRVFKDHRAAQIFQCDCIAHHAQVLLLHALTRQLPHQRFPDEPQEVGVLATHRIAQVVAQSHRQHRVTDHRTDHQSQHHLGDACHRRIEHIARMRGDDRQRDDRRRVAGQDERIGFEIAMQRGTGRTGADPHRHHQQERLALLREQRHHAQRRSRADQRAQHAIETLGQHHAALAVHDDHRGQHRRARLRQLHAHRQPAGDEERQRYPQDEQPGTGLAIEEAAETGEPVCGPAVGRRR
ncbi:hypothetical protein D3C81_1366020 [compost metagenome]